MPVGHSSLYMYTQVDQQLTYIISTLDIHLSVPVTSTSFQSPNFLKLLR